MFVNLYESTIKETLIYNGNYLNLINIEVELPNGNKANRDIVKHPGACAIIPFLDESSIILIDQFRKPLEKTILEIPADKIKNKVRRT